MRIVNNLSSLLRIRRGDVLLLSYPKSGSTWLRGFLFHYEKAAFGGFEDPYNINYYMPEIGKPHTFANGGRKRVIKTHRLVFAFLPVRTIHQKRHPFSVLLSSYAYFASRGITSGAEANDLAAFAQSRKFGYAKIANYQRYADKLSDYVISYEDMNAYPVETFRSLVLFLFGSVDPTSLKYAIERSSFNSMKQEKSSYIDSKHHFSDSYQFFNKGISFDYGNLTDYEKEVYDAVVGE